MGIAEGGVDYLTSHSTQCAVPGRWLTVTCEQAGTVYSTIVYGPTSWPGAVEAQPESARIAIASSRMVISWLGA